MVQKLSQAVYIHYKDQVITPERIRADVLDHTPYCSNFKNYALKPLKKTEKVAITSTNPHIKHGTHKDNEIQITFR